MCIRVCACTHMCACVIWFTSGFEFFRRILGVRLWGHEWVQALKWWWHPGHQDPLRCHILITSNTCSFTVYSSPVFCEAQMENNRRFGLFSQFWGIVITMSIFHWWQTRAGILIDSLWLFFETYCSTRVKSFSNPVSSCCITKNMSCILKHAFIEESGKVNQWLTFPV